MPRTISLRLASLILIACGLLSIAARPQSQNSQTQSVADAARKAREQKKSEGKPPVVITNDTLKPRTDEEKAVYAANEPKAAANSANPPASEATSNPEAKPESAAKSEDAKKKKEKAELE